MSLTGGLRLEARINEDDDTSSTLFITPGAQVAGDVNA
jgi:hypothetical protein